MDGQDKRRDPRIRTTQQVWVEGQEVRCEGQAKNMSSRGMFVVAKASAPQVGSTLDVTFDDPLEGEIALKMEVVWRDSTPANAGVGLKITDPTGSKAFQRVVARYLRLQAVEAGQGESKGEPDAATGKAPSAPSE